MAKKPPREDSLARVGTQGLGVPEDPPSKPEGEGRKTPWLSSAKEELDRFKGVPVVGTLPWRTQYVVLAAVLGASLLGLLAMMALPGGGGVSLAAAAQAKEAARQITTQVDVLSQGRVVDMATLSKAEEAGRAAAATLGLSTEWSTVGQAVGKLPPIAESTRALEQQSRLARQALQQGVARAEPLLQQARDEGTAWAPEGVALASALGDYRALAALLAMPSPGPDWAPAVEESSARILQGFNDFRASPLAGQDAALTRGWRELSAAWAVATPALGQARTAANGLAARDRGVAEARTASAALIQSVDARLPTGPRTPPPAALAIGGLAVVCLVLLLWVARRQQQWQALSTQAAGEQNDQAIMDMMEDLDLIGAGDLTRKARVSESTIGTLADTVNKTVDQVRRMILAAKKATAETMDASVRANEASGIVVDSQRNRLAVLEGNSQDVLKLVEAVGAGADGAARSKALADQARTIALAGHGAVNQSLEKMREARERVDEAMSRAQRLVASAHEIAGTALALRELAEQLEILGMQADLQAAKAGESGQGFRVVARGVQELADASGQRARNVQALVETALSDLEALLASMASATERVDEGSGLTDVSYESWSAVKTQLESLLDAVASLKENASQQEGLAELLDKRTRHDLGQAAQASRQTQEASEAIVDLIASVQSMEQTIGKIKA